MRKILLAATAAAAVLGTTASAFAQAPAPSIRPGRAPWVGAPFSPLAGPAAEPGSVQVFLRGAYFAGIAASGVTGDTVKNADGTVTKNQPISIYSYFRLYPSFEGTTAQGLKYGAFGEIRQTAGTSTANSNNNSSTLAWRRAYGYVGGSWGQFRFGPTEGANAIMQTGTMELGTGLMNGDAPGFMGSGAQFTWPFLATNGQQQKLIYLSPSFSGFDFGFSFEPQTAGINAQHNCTGAGGVASSGCVRLESIAGGTFQANQASLLRNRNTLEAVGRYQGNLGPVGLVASLGILSASNVKDGGLTGGSVNGGAKYKYKNPFVVQTGLTATYGGLTVGGALKAGSVNPNNSRNSTPVKQGEKDEFSFLLGASYVTGPWQVGGAYVVVNRAGAYAADLTGATTTSKVGSLREMGLSAMVAYAYGPGATLQAEINYAQRHQLNSNLYTASTTGGNFTRVGNNAQSTVLLLNNTFVW